MGSWPPPPGGLPPLRRDEVHVHLACLTLCPATARRLETTLSPEERDRADRFHGADDRRRYVARRGLLRALLGRYLDVAPERVAFRRGPRGKPALCAATHGDGLCFSASHSHERALFALSGGRQVGADIERVGADLPLEDVARRFFSAGENADLRALPAALRPRRMLEYWTCREAYAKARGEGLALALGPLEVAFAAGGAATLRAGGDDPRGRWLLRRLDAAPGYVAALAVQGSGWRAGFACRRLPPGAFGGIIAVASCR